MKPENFSSPFAPPPCRVTVVIKALNEERHIAAAIESALRAVAVVGGEVVLADCCSSDRTVALAQAYPVRIVQLSHPHERRCGAGAQLGYQHARGEFIYLLDGDMQMLDGFLEPALDFLKAHPGIAGIGGQVVEHDPSALAHSVRAAQWAAQMKPGSVDRLEGGGLYRRSAIEASGYLCDRNLHSHEAFELAARLRSGGWDLWRLPLAAARHFGPEGPPYDVLLGCWRSGYFYGPGEVVRACAGQPRLRRALQDLREWRIGLGVLAWWAVLVSVPFWSLGAPARLGWFGALCAAPLLALAWRRRSLRQAVYTAAFWSLGALGGVRGLLGARAPARQGIASKVLKEPSGFSWLPTPDARH